MTEDQKISWKRVAVEAATIVASILFAFAIDAWWENLAESEDEYASLELIRRDLNSAVNQLGEFSDYSASAMKSALRAYSALSNPGPYDRDAIRVDLHRVDRRTLRLPTAAYTELVSTGTLRVIQDRRMRDAIVQFYESLERIELIIQKINDEIIDRQLSGQYFESGLLLPHMTKDAGSELIDEVFELANQRLGADFVHRVEPIWGFPSDSPEWRSLRSVLLNAALAHGVGEIQANRMIIDATQLENEIEEWLSAR